MDRRLIELRPCQNPACDRRTAGALYCCAPCANAHEGKYDPDGYHSPGCDQRTEARTNAEFMAGDPKVTFVVDDEP